MRIFFDWIAVHEFVSIGDDGQHDETVNGCPFNLSCK